MTPEILSQLKARMKMQPRGLEELHHAARAAGSNWSADQVRLILACLTDVIQEEDLFRVEGEEIADPLVEGLLAVATEHPMPAAVLLARLPKGPVVTAAGLCEIARIHPEFFEVIPPNRIRRR